MLNLQKPSENGWRLAGGKLGRRKGVRERERENGGVFEQRPLYARTGFQYISPPPISDVFVNKEYYNIF